MNKLDENYLDLVREALYNPQFKTSLRKNNKSSKNLHKLKNNVDTNEDSPKNVVKTRFKTKKETFKAKAKLKKRVEQQTKPKQVRFIDNSLKNGTEVDNSQHAPSDVKSRIATPFKIRKAKPVHMNKSPEHSIDISATIVKHISPSLKENLPSDQNIIVESLENVRDADISSDISKNSKKKSKKRRRSQSGTPEINVKRKKDKSFAKKGKQLAFDDSSDENESNKQIHSEFSVREEKEEIRNKIVKCEEHSPSTADTSVIDQNDSDLNNTWLNFIHSVVSNKNAKNEAKKIKKPKKKIKDKIRDESLNLGTNEEGNNAKKIKKPRKKVKDKSLNLVTNEVDNNPNETEVENDPKETFIVEKVSPKTDEFVSKISECSSKLPNKKLKNIKLKNVSKSINSTSSESPEKGENGLRSKKKSEKFFHPPEDPSILFDIYDDETVGVKGLKFRKFCGLFPPTYNEQFLGQNLNPLHIPKKYFNLSQNDFELESKTEISNDKTRKKYKLNDQDSKNTSNCTSSECDTDQLDEDKLAQKINQKKKVKKNLNQEENVSILKLLSHNTEKTQDFHQEKLYGVVDSTDVDKDFIQKENVSNLQVFSNDTEKTEEKTQDSHQGKLNGLSCDSSQENIENSFNSSQLNADENPCENQNSEKEIQNRETAKQPTIITMKNGNKVIVLGLNEQCYIHGLCLIKVLHGEIEILGANVSRESGEKKFYSPRGSALLYVRNKSILYVSNLIKLKDIISQEMLHSDNDANLTFEHHSAIFECSKHKDPCIDFIEKYIPQKIFPDINGQGPRIDLKLSGIWNRIQTSEKWEELLENVTDESKTVISGGKGVGKSTFLRFAVNFLLRKFKKIRVIDLDPGQSEFYPPGCLTVTTVNTEVFGPNYTHLMKPDSLILSHINIGYDIKKYLRSVQYILESTVHMESLPTLINFPGFTQGIGFDITVQTLKYIQPNLVIQINSKSHNKNYKTDITDKEVNHYINNNNCLLQDKLDSDTKLSYNFVKLKSLAENNETWSLEARQGREINILSYFGQMMSDSVNDFINGDLNMYSINISSLSITNSEGKEIPPSTLNANLVALCSELKGNSDIFSCYGYGFVRGMDLDNDMLVLITPETIETLENVSQLVLSSVTTPPSLLMTTADVKGHIPYISVGDLVDFSQFTKRSYLPPRQ